ncbi:MAG: VOC family protein [Thermodesulfobacteriota bacterium]
MVLNNQEKNSPVVQCRGINQIGIAVRDVEATAKSYWSILGIGPWAVLEWEAPAVYDRTYHGRPVTAKEKLAFAQAGGVQIELVQAVEGPSIYGDWLEERGEGLHHLNFLVDDLDETVEILTKQGYPSLQSGRCGAEELRGGYNYIDLKPLHSILEPVRQVKVKVKSFMVPDADEKSPSMVQCRGINQIGIAVRDVEATAKNYWSILGIGPWVVIEWEAPAVYDRTYHGRPVTAKEKLAFAQAGGVEIELVQAVEGPSIYGDWLEERGEGLHHLNFLVDDLDETVEILTKQGFPSLQSGRCGAEELRGGYNYIDLKPLHSILEPVRQVKVKVKSYKIP